MFSPCEMAKWFQLWRKFLFRSKTAYTALLACTLACCLYFLVMQKKKIFFRKRIYRAESSRESLVFPTVFIFSWITHLSQTLMRYKEVSDPDAEECKMMVATSLLLLLEKANVTLLRLFLSFFLPGVEKSHGVYVNPGNY